MSNVQPQLLLRAKFLEALTSGEYEQCRGQYRNFPTLYDNEHGFSGTAYCILGLAYKLIGGENWTKHFHDELEEAYGFRNAVTLMSLNDTGCSFAKLAKIIREHPNFVYGEKPVHEF